MNASLDVGPDRLEIVLGSANRVFGLHFADNGNVVEGYVALSPHTIEQLNERSELGIEVLPRKLNDRGVMAQLHPRTLPVAQHQRQRGLDHGLIRGLVSGFFVDG